MTRRPWCPALLACLAATPLAAQQPATGSVYSGWNHQTSLEPPRIDADVTVDGQLDEAPWSQAARLTGFSQYAPTDGIPAQDSTEVLVWYSGSAIYFGIRAFESHGPVHGTLANRDAIFSDDNVQIYLSTFNDGRQATLFAVNPLGIQGDGALVETGSIGGGILGNAATGGRENPNLSPDYVYQSKGVITSWGYQVEVRIPFKSLRYQSANVQSWGLDIERDVQHNGTEETWAPARRASASFLAQSGTLTGLTDLHRGLVMDLNPEITGRDDGAPDSTGKYAYNATGPEFGANVRWGVTNNLTLTGAANPDFSQVESDAGQIAFDPRQALNFPEKRPFFLDGLEFFQSPFQLVYTRQITQPVAAVKLTGKAAGTNIGAIAAVDDADAGYDPGHNPVFGIIRAQRDLGTTSKIGVVLTDRADGPDVNQVGAVDGRFVFGGVYNARFQVGMSHTVQGDSTFNGPIWFGQFSRAGHTFGWQSSFTGISDKFFTGSGFISRTGVAEANVDPSYSVYGLAGGLVQRATTDLLFDRTWQYQHLIHGLGRQDDKLHLNLNTILKGGWAVGGGYFWESFGYDSALFANYRLITNGGADTIPFAGQPHITNGEYVISVATPTFRRFDANAFWLQGHDENYAEWASGDLIILQGGINWRPNDQLRVSGTYNWEEIHRRTDGTLVTVVRIPRITLEYQVSRPLFVRLVGQYMQNEVDSLRDNSRTELPIWLETPGGLVRAGPQKSDLFHMDALLSYQPNPGTVFYAGYGSNQTEPIGFRFQDFTRLNDNFFVKLSYLFRL